MATSSGIHHITAITSDPQKNLDFYEGFLGQRLVKRTVNFDDPRSYHFYYGDESGKPGTLMTFFYWPGIPPRKKGAGEVSRVAYGINRESKEFWLKRAEEFDIKAKVTSNSFGEELIQLQDPDNITIELVLTDEKVDLDYWSESPVEESKALLGFYGATLSVKDRGSLRRVLSELGYTLESEYDEHSRFVTNGNQAFRLDLTEEPELEPAGQGSGSVHHIALRAATEEDELLIRDRLLSIGLSPTPVVERNYFRSVYFQTPSNILFEIATDGPGNTIDEPLGSLGENLVLPEQYEPHREFIESILVPITLPRHKENGKDQS